MDTLKENLFKNLNKEIHDVRVLQAIKDVPREEFVHETLYEYAYFNVPLDIGYEQTISQPSIVALMTELLDLKSTDTVLDIGTGSGYQAAILSKLCKQVVSVEIVPELAKSAKERLKRLGYTNVTVVKGDGKQGCESRAPYDKILCAAAVEEIPKSWIDQLDDDGIMVFPLKMKNFDELVRGTKTERGILLEYITAVRFVPLV